MMKTRTFSELIKADQRSLRFTPLGLSTGGGLSPEDAADFQQQSIASYELQPQVSENTRLSFARIQLLHTYGVLFYEAFTLATDLTWLTLEQALRERFITYYAGSIPFVNEQTEEEKRIVTWDFSDVYKEFLKEGELRDRRWKLQIKTTNEAIYFRGSMSDLLTWARREKLLYGQRNQLLESLYPGMRNSVAHSNYSLTSPPTSVRSIRNLSEIINRLWGFTTPGGLIYPAPTSRNINIVAWNSVRPHQTHIQIQESQLSAFQDKESWSCRVFRSVPEDEVFGFDPDFELTNYPCELLWGPGNLADAEVWLKEIAPSGDTVTHMDRLFAFRMQDGRVSNARRPSQVIILAEENQEGEWLLVRADFPKDACVHARHVNEGRDCNITGPLPSCPVEEIFAGKWSDLTHHLMSQI